MSEFNTPDLTSIATDCQKLIASQQTLLLSTVSEQCHPQISYAPYVRDQPGHLYIYVSELAAHTRNLLQKKPVSIMFIRQESESRNLFARERAVFSCTVSEVPRDDEHYPIQLQALQEKFGDVINVLRSLADFHLFILSPQSGQYVIGFGQAYNINIKDGTLYPIKKNPEQSQNTPPAA